MDLITFIYAINKRMEYDNTDYKSNLSGTRTYVQLVLPFVNSTQLIRTSDRFSRNKLYHGVANGICYLLAEKKWNRTILVVRKPMWNAQNVRETSACNLS